VSKLRIELPGMDEPGFLRRTKRALQLREQLVNFRSGPTPSAVIDSVVDFLVDYVTEPADKNEAKEMLLDASQNQFMEMLNAIAGTGGDTNPTSPNPS